MKALARVKLSNTYDLIVNELPINSELNEGTTTLLLTDGTSWEFVDDKWNQIEIAIDQVILNTLYPFIMAVGNSIHNNFVRCELSQLCEEAMVATVAHKNAINITGLTLKPKAKVDDYVIIKTCLNEYLTTVLEVTDTNIVVDNTGLDIRLSAGESETVAILLVSFPPQYINAVLRMLGFDIFVRDSKEKRQERLGNYTYTNFEPHQYYGLGSYPENLENGIKYWQKISI